MKAVILAAGRGTRMGSLTDTTPKPMLDVRGRPILQHIIEGIRDAGMVDIQIIVGHMAHLIEERFADGAALGVTITYTRQHTVDGTGSAAALAEPFVGDEPFLMTFGDILVAPPTYSATVARFAEGKWAGVIAARALGEEAVRGGIMLFDDDFCLTSLLEKPGAEELAALRREGILRERDPLWYNAGVYLFTPLLFSYTRALHPSPRGEYELTDAIIDMAKAGHKLAGVEIRDAWVEVGDPQVLASLNRDHAQ